MRFRCFADASWSAEVPDGVGGWREMMRGSYGDWIRIIGYTRNPRYAWALSNRGRKRMALVRLDLRNGREELLYEHPSADISGGRVLDGGFLSFVWAWPAFQEWRFYDAFLEADLSPYLKRERSAVYLLSEDRQRRWMTFGVASDRGDGTIYLMDRGPGETKVLAESPLAAYRDQLAPMEPVTFTARDGLTLHGLLTVPLGASGPRPMVLLVHGGPWAHDNWGFNATVQFLANRGYAVLQVNYRGSTGYGREYTLAGTREFARKMHDDLVDGVRWAIDRGVADPKKVAIMGASYGGYSALSGAAFTPDMFVAAVDVVGIADMVSLIEDWPKYWRVGDMGFWSRFFADPRKPEERSLLAERSPLNHVDAIRVPLLVVQGANDVRVRRDQSDRMVAALRAHNHEVEYLLFPDEGHSFNRTPNRIAYMRAVERFLARHLGGRDGGDGLDTDAPADSPTQPTAR
jgi:dipeptidyl aminopeptidase/acylaminoacyl peptidase